MRRARFPFDTIIGFHGSKKRLPMTLSRRLCGPCPAPHSMSSASTRSPILGHELHHRSVPPQIPHSDQHECSYCDYKYCVPCSYRSKYGSSNYELNSEATSSKKRLYPEATEHSYSSPKVFRNTHPPTSAIRNTLIEPATHKRRGKERRVDSTPPSAPYPQRSPRRENSRVNDEDIRRQDTRFASPESSFALRRPVTPEYVESSLRAVGLAHHGTVTSTPHYSTSVRETSGRSSAVTIDNLRSPHQTTKRRPLSLAFLVATDSAPVPSSPPLGDDDPILPPLHRLKRKLSQMQDATSERSNPPLKPAAAVRPQKSHSDVARQPVSSTGVPDSMPPAVTYEEDGESPEKK